MSEETQPMAESDHGAAWTASVVASLLLYILSPPPLLWALEKASIDEAEWFEWVYAPLGIAYDNFEPVEKFYDAYFELLGFEM